MVSVTGYYFPKYFLLEALSNSYTFRLVTAGFFWQVLESIHKSIVELYALLHLFVRGPNKQQRSGKIISNFTKGETFLISYNNQVLLGIISQCNPPSCTLQKCFPLLFSLAKKRIYLDISKKSLRFVLKTARELRVELRKIELIT